MIARPAAGLALALTVVRVEKPPTFPTSFDCARASTDAEITICEDEELAELSAPGR